MGYHIISSPNKQIVSNYIQQDDLILGGKPDWFKVEQEREPEERLVQTVYRQEMPGKRPRGQPRKRWKKDLIMI